MSLFLALVESTWASKINLPAAGGVEKTKIEVRMALTPDRVHEHDHFSSQLSETSHLAVTRVEHHLSAQQTAAVFSAKGEFWG